MYWIILLGIAFIFFVIMTYMGGGIFVDLSDAVLVGIAADLMVLLCILMILPLISNDEDKINYKKTEVTYSMKEIDDIEYLVLCLFCRKMVLIKKKHLMTKLLVSKQGKQHMSRLPKVRLCL